MIWDAFCSREIYLAPKSLNPHFVALTFSLHPRFYSLLSFKLS
ncbi:hypothetical protein PLIP_a2352 [Pseudoalteromonas lipolytica LMEB 39]|nr:hypothetical protein [Pseudoalteromonas lipolytica LMEB 39]